MLKIGLIGIGLDTYWEQFKGLEERLIGYLNEVEAKMRRPDVEVVNMGMVDNTDSAFQAGTRLREHAVDLIFNTRHHLRPVGHGIAGGTKS